MESQTRWAAQNWLVLANNKNEAEVSATELVPSIAPLWAPSWQERPAHHHDSYGVIELFVNLVLYAPTSFRGAHGALEVFAPSSPLGDVPMPSANCGTYWLLRMGLYELTRPLEIADDWIWLVDHTVQIGAIRCLLIVGIRLSVWQQLERPLIHQDLSVVALEPAELSTAEQVRVEYEKGAQRTGTPRAILSDGARNLQRATDDFRSQHPKTSPLSDIKHNEERLWFQKCDRPDLQPQVERRVREYNRANTTANTTNTN